MDINHYTAVDSNKEVLTNVFIKGMNTDTSDTLIGEDLYRYAENIRIITDTASNTGEARIIEGNSQVIVPGLTGEIILATNSIRNIGIFITLKLKDEDTNDEDTGWCIYKYDFDKPSVNAEKIFGPCKTSILKEYPEDLDFLKFLNKQSLIADLLETTGKNGASVKKTITTVLRWESDDNIKLYIADGIHELMAVSLSNGDLGSDFDAVFGSLNVILPKLTTRIYEYPGLIDGPVVQYAYRLYEQNGASTPLSSLTQPLYVYQTSENQTIGVEPNSKSVNAVEINMASINVTGPMQYVQIYRIDYALIGESPKVSLVYDGTIISTFVDYGSSLQTTITDADLIAMLKLLMIPSIIESKENYLFAAGVKYQQDNIDDQFKTFDARAYNKGMFIEGDKGSKTYIILQNGSYNFPPIDLQDNISSNLIQLNKYKDYTSADWGLIGTTGYNGIGPCFAWRYVLTDITYKQYYSKKDAKHYRRGEVYRFGVRLFDNKGRASSVKWIADILFPINDDTLYNKFNDIEFIPINTNLPAWQNVYGYEIVQCERTINDRIRLFSGIIGHTDVCDIIDGNDNKTGYDGCIYPNGYVSMMDITGYGGNLYKRVSPFPGEINSDNRYNLTWFGDTIKIDDIRSPELYTTFYYSHPTENIFLFVCPEYVYLKDDVKRVFETFGKNCTVEVNRLLKAGGTRYYPDSSGFEDLIQHDKIAYAAIRCGEEGFSENELYNKISYLYNTPMSFVSIQNEHTLRDSSGNYLPRHVLAVLYKDGTYGTGKTEYTTNLATVLLNYLPATEGVVNYGTNTDRIYSSYQLPIQIVRLRSDGSLYMNLGDGGGGYKLRTDTGIFDEGENRTISNDAYSYRNRYCIKHTDNENNLQFHTVSVISPNLEDDYLLKHNNVSKSINSFAFADALEYNDFGTEDGENFQFDTKLTAVGSTGKTFINCTNPYLKTAIMELSTFGGGHGNLDYLKLAFKESYGVTSGISIQESLNPVSDQDYEQRSIWARSADTGFGGSCILLNTDNITEHDIIGDDEYLNGKYKINNMPTVSIADITRKNVIPYGGIKDAVIKQSKYISVGAYTVCQNGEEYPSTVVNGGDTFFQPFRYCSSHVWYSKAFFTSAQPTILYDVYLETDIDLLGLTSKHLLGYNTFDYRTQEKVSSFGEGLYTQDGDQYTYNTAYGSTANVISYTPNKTTKALTNNYDTRVHNSQKKTNGELVDNWMTFKTTDFIDVDTQYGPITALQTFKNKLIFWQEEATGVLSVNERSIVQDINKTNIVLGTGGILDRYDYFTTVFGLKANQHNLTQSDSTLYWWDGYNKEILGYSDGYAVSSLSTIKSIKNYINNKSEYKDPTLIYNNKYKEVICNVVDDGAIIYSEQLQAFTSIYKYDPVFYLNIKNKLYTIPRDIKAGEIYLENCATQNKATLFSEDIQPLIEYTVNKNPQATKTFDIQTFGGRFYGGEDLSDIIFSYKTPLKQSSSVGGDSVTTTREYDFRLNIPRDGIQNDQSYIEKMQKSWGDRMRGKFIRCVILSTSSDLDFSLQYITTKFRTSWT